MSLDETMQTHQKVVERFKAVCQADKRVVSAFIGGSYATGNADEYSDLDLYLITTTEAYVDFFAERQRFLARLGDPVFAEDFHGFGFDMVVFILVNGVEGELALADEGRFHHIHGGPFRVLVDKKEILSNVSFPLQKPTRREQQEALRRLVYWFWRDLSLFITAMARERLWTAYGYLESLQLKCVNLARLTEDFTVWAEGYEKLEQAVAPQALLSLQVTIGPMTQEAMLEMAWELIRFYQGVVPHLAESHGIEYPTRLESIVSSRLKTTIIT